MPHALLALLPASSALESSKQLVATHHIVGAYLARCVAGSLSSLPVASLSWSRDGALCKPYADSHDARGVPVAEVNLSHDAELVACAFLCDDSRVKGRVGIDVLALRRLSNGVALPTQQLGAGPMPWLDAAALAAAEPALAAGGVATEALAFAVRWSLMESVLKARGQGLAVAGAGAAVLAEAMPEVGEGDPCMLWGATLEAVSDGDAIMARLQAAASVACGGVGDGNAAVLLPHVQLVRCRGADWRARCLLVCQRGFFYVLALAQVA